MIRATTLTGIAFALLAALAAWWSLTRYSSFAPAAPDVPAAYDAAIRTALRSGLDRDSARVARSSVAAEPAAWLTIAVATDSALVRAWAEGRPLARMSRSGDTTLVFWSTPASIRLCAASGALTAAFVGDSTEPRLVGLGSHCIPVAPIRFEIER